MNTKGAGLIMEYVRSMSGNRKGDPEYCQSIGCDFKLDAGHVEGQCG